MKVKTKIKLRLFVTDQSVTARRAVENLKAVCDDPIVKQDYDIDLDIVDVNESPQSAEENKILVTPTLLKTLPLPVRRVVGDLSNEEDIFLTLDITASRRPSKRPEGEPV